jgi:hypothetical protein
MDFRNRGLDTENFLSESETLKWLLQLEKNGRSADNSASRE